ncbi:MAG: hypothetical protein CMJ64_25400 [Planctomycetaceae bacterium]|nr:hypothetical protein [Planctomycetaceae bacterium]
MTGYSDSKVDRLTLISQHLKLVPLVADKLVGPSIMVKLIKACKSNEDKLSALINALEAKRADAIERAREWKDIIRSNKHIKYERRDKDKRDPKTYFKNVDWDAWEDALLDDVKESDRSSNATTTPTFSALRPVPMPSASTFASEMRTSGSSASPSLDCPASSTLRSILIS